LIVVLSGPGGVGKGALVERLLARDPLIWLSRSWTTRARRRGEAPDAYVFVDRDAFETRIRAGGFLEWAPFLDYLQGTPIPDPPAGSDVLLEIDVEGARQVRERHPDALLLFVDAPSPADQRARLEKRGDPPDRIEQRLALAAAERDRARALGATFVVNDDLDRAVEEIGSLIAAARARNRG
jgi:guanylate kinase